MHTSPSSREQPCFDLAVEKLQAYLKHESTWEEHLHSIKSLKYNKMLKLKSEWLEKSNRLREEACEEFNRVSPTKVDPKRLGDPLFIARVIGLNPPRKKPKGESQ